MAIHEVRARLVREQLREQHAALHVRYAIDADGVTRAHIQGRAAGLRVNPADRMQLCGHRAVGHLDRHGAPKILFAIPALGGIAAPRRMHAHASLHLCAQGRRQGFPCAVLVGEQGIAAHRRNVVAVEQRGRRR